jgi:hypothetical protein
MCIYKGSYSPEIDKFPVILVQINVAPIHQNKKIEIMILQNQKGIHNLKTNNNSATLSRTNKGMPGGGTICFLRYIY